MGILKHLLFWPATGPLALASFSVRQVGDLVHRERTDDASVKEDLLELQLRLELGEIDDEEFVRREAALMVRLREIRALREETGMQAPWAPLEFPPKDPEGKPVEPTKDPDTTD